MGTSLGSPVSLTLLVPTGGECHWQPGHLLLQLLVCPPTGEPQVGWEDGGGWLGVPCAQDWAAAGPWEGGGSTAPTPGLAPCSAFNNILSNLGYVLLGLLFLLIILQREINYNRALLRNDAHALVRDRAAWGASGCLGKLSLPGPHTSPPSLCSAVQECGIPKHFGLFYAMGTALMMEGLLSACYHVCPNYTNFQFGECPPGPP